MKPLLPFCSIPVAVTRDQSTGQYAKLVLPGLDHYWYASGATYTNASSTLEQDTSRTLTGINQADTFQKSCCDTCSGH